jgi:hypothetical protein
MDDSNTITAWTLWLTAGVIPSAIIGHAVGDMNAGLAFWFLAPVAALVIGGLVKFGGMVRRATR